MQSDIISINALFFAHYTIRRPGLLLVYHNEAYCSVRIVVHLKCQNINPMRRGCSTHYMVEMTCLSQFDFGLRSRYS